MRVRNLPKAERETKKIGNLRSCPHFLGRQISFFHDGNGNNNDKNAKGGPFGGWVPRVGPLSAKLVEDDETWLDTKVCRLLLRWFSLKGNYVGIPCDTIVETHGFFCAKLEAQVAPIFSTS